MKRQLAIKALTASDLTLFEWHYRNENAGNQKAINLNANVFVHTLYPRLPEFTLARDGRFPLDLYIYGPDAAAELNLQRKVIKFGTSYKNWRLDGEVISNPLDAPSRFNAMAPGDLAVMEFTGQDFPVSARMVLLAAAAPRDAALHARLAPQVESMGAMTLQQLGDAITAAQTPDDHPVHELLLEEAMEDAALGGNQGVDRLVRRRGGRRISRKELMEARERAEALGRFGEELIELHLQARQEADEIIGHEWTSDANPVAPYDFRVTLAPDIEERIDVKTTSGPFTRPVHVSLAELREMADESTIYRLYRVYDAQEGRAYLRVSDGIAPLAHQILATLQTLPPGVSVDSFSIDPSGLAFGDPIPLTIE